jgi:hypothetical protein
MTEESDDLISKERVDRFSTLLDEEGEAYGRDGKSLPPYTEAGRRWSEGVTSDELVSSDEEEGSTSLLGLKMEESCFVGEIREEPASFDPEDGGFL